MSSSNIFNRPSNPIGYALFTPESFRGRFFHLKDLREFCKSHHINPCDTVVFRVFYPDKSDFDRKLMDIREYAFPHFETRTLGSVFTQIKTYKWDAQDFTVDKYQDFNDTKNYIILSLHNLINWFKLIS
jgi:hypothetical protein